jgi:hypothetical protein
VTKHHRERILMRMRSALAVAALTAALSATGAAAASADDYGSEYRDDHHVACSPYFGELVPRGVVHAGDGWVAAEIEWGGAVSHNGPFDI